MQRNERDAAYLCDVPDVAGTIHSSSKKLNNAWEDWEKDIMKTKKINFLKLTKITYWILVIFVLLSIPFAFYLKHKGVILCPSNALTYSDTIYTSNLAFVFGIIGFLIAVIIFLIQSISSRYHSEKLPIFLRYFITTLIILLAYVLFNFLALFLRLSYPWTLLSLTFSISLVPIILTTIVFAYYNTKPSTILTMISGDIIEFIKKEKAFIRVPVFNDIAYTEEFTESLKKKVLIFIRNIAGAIRNNQDAVLENSLEGLRQISHHYLEQSRHIQSTEDKFLSELNDQFSFIVSESLKNYNQKILEDVAETIGAVALDIIRYRKGIGDINDSALHWLATLKDLFIKSYDRDRTIVCHICLERINDVVILILDKGYYRSYGSHKRFIDEISEFLSNVDQTWAANLLQNALLMHQLQFLKFLELAKTSKISFNAGFLRDYFGKFAAIVNKAKNTHKWFGNTIIFASLYGFTSFAQRIAMVGLMDLKEEKIKRDIAIHIEELIEFNKTIMAANPEKNDYRVYDSFTELLYLITKYIDLTDNNRRSLVELLSNSMVDHIKKRYIADITNDGSGFHDIKKVAIDYFALLIYLYQDNPEIINHVMQQLVEIYDLIKGKADDENQQNIVRSLYRELKLYSCWIDIFPNLRGVNEPIIRLLRRDLDEPTSPYGRKWIPSFFEEYGYPESSISGLTGLWYLWYLPPSNMWSNRFQEEISEKLNGEEGKLYVEFHEMLKSSFDDTAS